jgi:PAS domain S-box-containing protein
MSIVPDPQALALAAQHMDEGVIVCGPDRRIVWTNAAFARITGYDADESLGRRPAELLHGPHTDPGLPQRIRAQLEAGQPFAGQVVNHRKDGEPYLNEIEIRPLRDLEGALQGWVSLHRPVDRLLRTVGDLRRARQPEGAIFDAYGLWELDGDGLWVSARWIGMLGLSAEAAPHGRADWLALVHPDERGAVARALAGVQAGCGFDLQYRLRHADGTWRWVQAQGRPVADGGRSVGTHLDISPLVEAQRGSEARLRQLRALAAAAPGLLCQYHQPNDGPPRLIAVDAARLRAMCGMDPEPLAADGRPFLERIPVEHRAVVIDAIDASRRTGEIFERAFPWRHPDGRMLRLAVRSAPETQPDGSVLWHGVIDDVSDASRHSELLRRLESQVSGMLYQFELRPDGSMRMPYASAGVDGVFAVQAADLAISAEPILARVHEGDRPQLTESILVSARNLAPWHSEFRYRHPDGRTRWIEARSVPDPQADGTVLWHGFASDVTERRLLEDQLRRAAAAAGAAAEAKTAFLATMSHEIRTPMNGVIGMIDLLRSAEGLPEDAREQADLAHASAQQLMRILDDILDFSRLEAGGLALMDEPYDLAETVRACAELFRARVQPDVAYEVAIADGPWRMHGDAGRVRQVLANLIGNAVKFTPAGRVRVALERVPDGCRIAIEDTGIGIDEDTIGRLFTPFTQAETGTSRRFGGSGLGLAIARRLAGLMGGRIDVQSRPGSGSSFALMLPRRSAEPAQPSPTTPTPLPAAGLGLRVLLVEDEMVNRLVARDMLRRLGCAVEIAGDGVEALECMAEGRIDAVLMDVQMPRLDGREATRRWRERERSQGLPRLPIIALTAYALPEDREQCMQAGMDAFLSKPVSIAGLRGALAELVRQG